MKKIYAHLPQYILKTLEKENLNSIVSHPRKVEGAFVFMDVSGFTSLSENLSQYGREGTEVLTFEISRFFGKALESVFLFGGDVIKFGGDALTIFFERKRGEEKYLLGLRACVASVEVIEALKNYQAETKFGNFPLKLKVGISYGDATFIVLGDIAKRLEYIFSGNPLDSSAEAEHHCDPIDIVIDKDMADLVKNYVDIKIKSEGFYLLQSVHKRERYFNELFDFKVQEELIKKFMIPSVFNQINIGGKNLLSEHRPVVSCFVSFPSFNLENKDNCDHLQDYFLKVIELLKGFGGSFNRMDMGDKGSKFLCFFGAPESYLDNEERAVSFAYELKKLEKIFPFIKGQSIGITSGICYAGLVGSSVREEYTIMGDVVNVSARLMSLAKGTVLVSKEIRDRTKGKFSFSFRKRLSLKGKTAEISAYTLKKPIFSMKTLPAKNRLFVGREKEIETLKKILKSFKGLVSIFGEAGIGKSEIVKTLSQSDDFKRWSFVFISIPMSFETPFFIVRKILETLFLKNGFNGFNVENVRKVLKEEGELYKLFYFIEGKKSLLPKFFDRLTYEQKIETISGLFSRIVETISKNLATTVFILEDYEKISREDETLLIKIFERINFQKIKFIKVSRAKKEICQREKFIEIKGLSKDEIETFCKYFFDVSYVPFSFIEYVYECSNGNPLYISEIFSIFREKNIVKTNKEKFLVYDSKEVYSLSKSIQEIVLLRLDSLETIDKNLIKVASCFGEKFDSKTLSSIFVPKIEKNEIEKRLMNFSYLGIDKLEGNQFHFSNKLLQEVAYNSILISNKREIHREIGILLEKEGSEDESTLANHFGKGEDWEKAIQYSLKTARRAFEEQKYEETTKFYTLALNYSNQIFTQVENEDLLSYLKALITVCDYQKADEIIENLKLSDDLETRLNAQFYYLTILDQKGEYQKEFEKSIELIEKSRENNLGSLVVLTTKYAISSLIRLGKYDEALKWTEDAYREILKYEKEEELPNFYILFGSSLYAKGDYAKASEYYKMALSYGEEDGNFEIEIRALFGLSNCHLSLNRPENGLQYAQKAYNISKMVGSKVNILGAVTTVARCYLHLNKATEALQSLVNLGFSLTPHIDPYPSMTYFTQLGVTYYVLNQPKLALKQFRKTLKLALKVNNIQYIINASYNISDILKEIGEKKRARKVLFRLLKLYYSSIDSKLLKDIIFEILNLSENEKDCFKFKKIVNKIWEKNHTEKLFEDISNF